MSGINAKMSQEMVELGPRKIAHTLLEAAALSAIGAFNMTDDPARPWRFPKETHTRVARLLQEIMVLFEQGGFSEHRGPVVQVDAAFQALMAKCTVPGSATRQMRSRPRRKGAA